MEKRKWEQKDYEHGMPLLLYWWNYADFTMWAIMVQATLLPNHVLLFVCVFLLFCSCCPHIYSILMSLIYYLNTGFLRSNGISSSMQKNYNYNCNSPPLKHRPSSVCLIGFQLHTPKSWCEKLFQVVFMVNPMPHECSMRWPCSFSSAHISVLSVVLRQHWFQNIKVRVQTLNQKAMWCYLPGLNTKQGIGSRAQRSSKDRRSLQTSLVWSAVHCMDVFGCLHVYQHE